MDFIDIIATKHNPDNTIDDFPPRRETVEEKMAREQELRRLQIRDRARQVALMKKFLQIAGLYTDYAMFVRNGYRYYQRLHQKTHEFFDRLKTYEDAMVIVDDPYADGEYIDVADIHIPDQFKETWRDFMRFKETGIRPWV